MNDNNDTIWTKDFILLWVSNLFLAVGFFLLLPTLPDYALKILKANKGEIGTLFGVFTISAVMVRPVVGYLLDSINRRIIYLFAIICFAIILFLYPLASSLFILLIIRFFHGFTWGFGTTAGGTIAADLVPPKKRGEGLGYYGMTMPISIALGPIISIWLLKYGGYDVLFITAGSIVIFGTVTAFFMQSPVIKIKEQVLSIKSFLEMKVIALCLGIFFLTFSYSGMISFLTLYGEKLGIENSGFFFLAYAVLIALARPFSGRLFDTRGPELPVILGFLVSIAGLILLSMIHDMTGLLISGGLMGFGFGTLQPIFQAMAINLVTPDRRGVANSTLFTSFDLGIGTGSFALGWIADKYSMSFMFLISGIILVIPLVYSIVYLFKDYHNNKLSTVHSQ